MLLLILVALAVPAVSFAGGSAGDQQYTDPFGGTSGSGSHSASTSTSSPPTTTSSPAQTTPSAAPSTTPAASTPAADPTTAAAAPTTAGEPTATMAGGSSTTLPYTGYDAWTAVGFGLTLLAGGAALRWHLRARRA
jgi:cytoskeletal protein RodZ